MDTDREPHLKYESLGGDVGSITASGDRVSCLCLSDKILAIGTESGNVHVLDYSGNQVSCHRVGFAWRDRLVGSLLHLRDRSLQFLVHAFGA